jgi:hypothetical protein
MGIFQQLEAFRNYCDPKFSLSGRKPVGGATFAARLKGVPFPNQLHLL